MIGEKFGRTEILALYFKGGTLQLVHLQKSGAKICPLQLEEIEGDLAEQKLALSLRGKGCEVVTGLKSADLLVRSLELPLQEKRSILKALPFQAENLLPYPLDEAIILPQITKTGKKRSRVTLFSALKGKVNDHIAFFRSCYKSPHYVSAEPQALARVQNHFFPQEKEVAFLHIGDAEALFVCLEKGSILFASALDFRSEEELQCELLKTLLYLEQKKISSQRFIISGETSKCASFLIEKGFTLLDWPPEAESILPYLIPFGLALDALYADRKSLQFCQEEFACSEHYNKAKEGGRLLIFLSMTCLALMGAFGKAYLAHQEKLLDQRLATLVDQRGKNFPELSSVDLKNLAFSEKFEKVSKILKKEHLASKLYQPPPLLSDFLAYLSAHPNLSDDKGIEIDHLQYELLSFPTVERPQDPYQVKVTLTFRAKTPLSASQFYDALREGDNMIDSREEIQWSRNETGYQVSFFLR